jgi:tRNA modification GTPase
VHAALEGLAVSFPEDFISIDVRAALDALGEITGEAAGEDLLDTIFKRFCIGK